MFSDRAFLLLVEAAPDDAIEVLSSSFSFLDTLFEFGFLVFPDEDVIEWPEDPLASELVVFRDNDKEIKGSDLVLMLQQWLHLMYLVNMPPNTALTGFNAWACFHSRLIAALVSPSTPFFFIFPSAVSFSLLESSSIPCRCIIASLTLNYIRSSNPHSKLLKKFGISTLTNFY